MTKKRHDVEIRIYLYNVTDDEATSLRDKMKDITMATRNSDGNFIRSAVTSFVKKGDKNE